MPHFLMQGSMDVPRKFKPPEQKNLETEGVEFGNRLWGRRDVVTTGEPATCMCTCGPAAAGNCVMQAAHADAHQAYSPQVGAGEGGLRPRFLSDPHLQEPEAAEGVRSSKGCTRGRQQEGQWAH